MKTVFRKFLYLVCSATPKEVPFQRSYRVFFSSVMSTNVTLADPDAFKEGLALVRNDGNTVDWYGW